LLVASGENSGFGRGVSEEEHGRLDLDLGGGGGVDAEEETTLGFFWRRGG
jgi:hypothetical protein